MPRLNRASEASRKPQGSFSNEIETPPRRTSLAVRNRGNHLFRWVIRTFFGLVLAGGAILGLSLFATPPVSEAVALVRAEAAKHRTPYPSPDPPTRFIKALVATEDHRFYSFFDPGIDPFAVGRAIAGTILQWPDQGGSTIEQQLAKMLYTPRRRDLSAKLEQVVLALKLSFVYSKPEILAMYATVVYFGNGYYGLEEASCGYFGKRAADLSWTQAAMLAGILNGPAIFNPRTRSDATRVRESHVLKRLAAVGDLTKARAKAALAQPAGVLPATPRAGASSCL